jgi:hypothetical protein
MNFVILDIPPAGSWKRDCELCAFSMNPLSLQFVKDSDNSKWEINFDDYIAFKVTSEEFTIHLDNVPISGSFFLANDSLWLNDLKRIKSDVLNECKHFVLFFYDEVVEVISKNMTYVKLGSN